MNKVCVIGNTGRLGRSLVDRLGDKYEIVGINSSTADYDLLSQYDYWIVVVPPKVAREILEKLVQYIKKETVCISFVAGLSVEDVQNYLNHEKVLRAMTDVTGCLNAVCGDSEFFDLNILTDLFRGGTYQTFDKDEKINTFTLCLVVATVLTALHIVGKSNVSGEVINNIYKSLETDFGIDQSSLECLFKKISSDPNQKELLLEMQTPGGLSERLVNYLNDLDRIPEVKKLINVLGS